LSAPERHCSRADRDPSAPLVRKRAMPHTDTLRAAYAAFRSGDLPGVLNALDENIEWHVPTSLPQGGDFRGHDGVMTYFGGRAGALGAAGVTAGTALGRAARVVVLGSVRAATAASPFVHSWHFAGGRASRFDEYVG